MATAPRFHALEVADVRHETPDTVSIAFRVPDDLKPAYNYQAGQYLTLRTDIGGQDIRRSYSICSGLDDGELRVAIKKVEDGRFSGFANDNLAPGMTLDVMTPMGRFTAPIEPDNAKSYVGFAAGSGITPLMAIVKTVLTREPLSTFTLFYGNRDTRSIIFREALEDLKDRFLGRFSLFYTLSREGSDVDLFSGRLTGDKVRVFADHLFDPADIDHAFLCGPAEMIVEVHNTLRTLGVPDDRVHEELFTPADDVQPKLRSEAARQAQERGAEITAILDGAARQFVMTDQDGTVVDAGHRHGIELPYSCKGGMCCTCRCKVVDGSVEMAVNYSLEPWEVEAGYVLACQSRPTTDTVTLDFDQV
ncbi:MAG: 1,2-phenylacetyl-CoA epoxidase subunit PaaE [Pseudomonadota bacterium]